MLFPGRFPPRFGYCIGTEYLIRANASLFFPSVNFWQNILVNPACAVLINIFISEEINE